MPARSSAPVAAGAQAVAGLGDIQDGQNLQDMLPLEETALCLIDISRQKWLSYLQGGTSALLDLLLEQRAIAERASLICVKPDLLASLRSVLRAACLVPSPCSSLIALSACRPCQRPEWHDMSDEEI